MNRDGTVELGAVADAFTRVVADSPVNRGNGLSVVRTRQARSCSPTLTCAIQPSMFSPAGQQIAWRQQVDVHRPRVPHRPRAGAPVLQIREGRDVSVPERASPGAGLRCDRWSGRVSGVMIYRPYPPGLAPTGERRMGGHYAGDRRRNREQHAGGIISATPAPLPPRGRASRASPR
jgi:hypothetical protein